MCRQLTGIFGHSSTCYCYLVFANWRASEVSETLSGLNNENQMCMYVTHIM